MKTSPSTRCRWLLTLLMALYCGLHLLPALGQPSEAGQQARTYAFLGQYFRKLGADTTQHYRLDVRLLPVVSPYADHFDLRRVMQAAYLTNNQFITTIRVDTMLTAADFAAMREQLIAWQRRPRWSARRLRALPCGSRRRSRRCSPPSPPTGYFPRYFPAPGGWSCFMSKITVASTAPAGR